MDFSTHCSSAPPEIFYLEAGGRDLVLVRWGIADDVTLNGPAEIRRGGLPGLVQRRERSVQERPTSPLVWVFRRMSRSSMKLSRALHTSSLALFPHLPRLRRLRRLLRCSKPTLVVVNELEAISTIFDHSHFPRHEEQG